MTAEAGARDQPPMTAGTAPRYRRAIVVGLGADRIAAEQRLDAHGVRLPATDRADLLRHLGVRDALLLVLGAEDGAPVSAVNVESLPSRLLPGHTQLRVSRFGAGPDAAADEQILRWLTSIARRRFWCLALTIELFERDQAARARLAGVLRELGFTAVPEKRAHHSTLALELGRTTGAAHASDGPIHSTAGPGVELRLIHDASLAPQVIRVLRQTGNGAARRATSLPWKEIISLSAREPRLSRVTGLFDPRASGEAGLLSLAWGVRRGSYVTCEAGPASWADTPSRVRLLDAPVWDLVAWARHESCDWFDLGCAASHSGAGNGSAKAATFRAGSVVDVGEEFVFYPHQIRGGLSGLAGAAARIASPGNRSR